MIALPTMCNDRSAPTAFNRRRLKQIARRAALQSCRPRGAKVAWVSWTLLLWPGDSGKSNQIQVTFLGDRGKGKSLRGSCTIDL